jgi:ATP-dependent exoDNAse (exonuclease V) beta subunit
MKTASDIIDFFKDLTFEEEGHLYRVNGVPIEHSVSNLIKNFCKSFNRYQKSLDTSIRTGLSQEEVLKDWDYKKDISIIKGKKAHLFGELYPFNRDLRPQSPFDIAIMKFWNDLPPYVIPILTEARMYHKEQLYAGTADAILYNTLTGKYIITDYKTNIDLFKNYREQKMLGPFSHLLDCPYNKYQLQLSYYQILLEQIESIEVSYRKLIWLRPNGEYILYDTEDFTNILRT